MLADGFFIKLLLLPVVFVLLGLVLVALTMCGIAGVTMSFSTDRRSWVVVLCGLASLLAAFVFHAIIPVTDLARWPLLLPPACNLLLGGICLVRFCWAVRRPPPSPKA